MISCEVLSFKVCNHYNSFYLYHNLQKIMVFNGWGPPTNQYEATAYEGQIRENIKLTSHLIVFLLYSNWNERRPYERIHQDTKNKL